MINAQKYISVLLERLPKWELTSYDHQTYLDRLRDRISSATDLQGELERLYQVKNFSDFALSLMWISNKVEKGLTLEESTIDEENLVFAKYQQAMGITPTISHKAPEGPNIAPPPQSFPSSEPQISASSMESVWESQITQSSAQPSSQFAGGTTVGREQERTFAQLLERFLESVQSGTDDRTTLASDVINECNNLLNSDVIPDDYRQFCQLLVEFLKYIT